MAWTAEQEAELAQLKAGEAAEQEAKALSFGESQERELQELYRQEKIDGLDTFFGIVEDFSDVMSKTVKTAYRTYKEEADEGLAGMKGDFPITGIKPVDRALGGLRFIGATGTALGRGFLGEPIHDTTKSGLMEFGVSEEKAEQAAVFLGTMGEGAGQMFGPGYISKTLQAGTPAAIKAAQRLGRSGERGLKEFDIDYAPPITSIDENLKLGARLEAQFEPDEATKYFAGKVGAEGELMSNRVAQKLTKDVTEAADEALKGNMDGSKRLFKKVTQHLISGEIDPKGLPEILAKHGMSSQDFAAEFSNTMSVAGKDLNKLSQLSKRLKKTFLDDPETIELLREFENSLPQQGFLIDKLDNAYVRAENFRRGILVTQLATSVRNAISQTGRFTIGAFDEALQTVLNPGKGGSVKDDVMSGLTSFTALYNKLKPSKRKLLNEAMDTQNAAVAKIRLLSQPVHEVTLGSRLTNMLNIPNRAQEFFFRRMAFEAKLRQNLLRAGKNLDTIDIHRIPENFFDDATDYALEMTFAASPKSNFGKRFVDAWTKIPGLTTVNPFPRFAFANALPFVIDHSPLGLGKMLMPSSLKKLASGDATEFAKAASRGAIGTAMFEGAWRLRQSEYAGEKWYEVNLPGGKTLDTRAFAPFSTYLFLSEAMLRPERMHAADYAQAAIGLNRVAGSGLVVVDLLRSRDSGRTSKLLNTFLGQVMGSFSVPAKTPKDFLAHWDEEEAIRRDVKDNPLLGPFLQNLPVASKLLPESVSSTDTKRMKAEHPVLRQVTGLSIKTKSVTARELDKIDFNFLSTLPKTGNSKADRIVAEGMARSIEEFSPKIIENEGYQSMTDTGKQAIWNNAYQSAREEGRKFLVVKNPNLAIDVAVKQMDKTQRKLIAEYLGIPDATPEEVAEELRKRQGMTSE